MCNIPRIYPCGYYRCPYLSGNQIYPFFPCNEDFWNSSSNFGDVPSKMGDSFSKTGESSPIKIKDYGPEPFVVDIDKATKQNETFRTALWTGKHLQLTLMSIGVGEDIGLEIHYDVDQFIRVEEGQGIVMMGDGKNKMDFYENVRDDYIIIIPAGKWHNIINTGTKPLKLYSIYAPPQHPHGTVHPTKKEAEAAEKKHHQ